MSILKKSTFSGFAILFLEIWVQQSWNKGAVWLCGQDTISLYVGTISGDYVEVRLSGEARQNVGEIIQSIIKRSNLIPYSSILHVDPWHIKIDISYLMTSHHHYSQGSFVVEIKNNLFHRGTTAPPNIVCKHTIICIVWQHCFKHSRFSVGVFWLFHQ